MNISPSKCTVGTGWRGLYRAAILETDRKAVLERVLKAEKAVVARGRELFGKAGTLEEKEALEDALYALHGFESAWSHTAGEHV